jgi:uncharacterized protein YndB with AHSA1/START domain
MEKCLLYRSTTIAVSIDCPLAEVYEFLVEPLNLPTWTLAVERIEHREGNDWTGTTAEGEVIFRYPKRNEYGVLDYAMWRVGEPEGALVPLRVVPNADGTEVLITYHQRPGISDEVYESELEWTRADLLTLKTLLEGRTAR